jgi:hypothetical protein
MSNVGKKLEENPGRAYVPKRCTPLLFLVLFSPSVSTGVRRTVSTYAVYCPPVPLVLWLRKNRPVKKMHKNSRTQHHISCCIKGDRVERKNTVDWLVLNKCHPGGRQVLGK